ncbi:fibronectin type III domain-containing protein [Geobacter sp.]|uniref:LPS translocon maturation chaperone LptM n=1 Tax=Geobacter sp. TaxID=46610 RepID=UPI00260BB0F0|nr:fibronectin type III domain-containing protein [Geobacter sp.]
MRRSAFNLLGLGALALAGLLLVAGCGKKGPLVPPEAFAPGAVDTLAVEQKGDRFFVSWEAPTRDAGGRPLKDLAGFRLYRRPVLPPGEDCEECPTAYRLVKTVDLDYLRDVTVFGNRYVVPDAGVENGTTYQYKVIAFRKDGSESAPSNRARRRKVAAPPAPRLAAASTPTGILLRWEPARTPGADFAGYDLYRRRGDDLGTLVLLTPSPVKEQRYEDREVERGVTYVYTVREVAGADGQLVEGAASNEASGALAAPTD